MFRSNTELTIDYTFLEQSEKTDYFGVIERVTPVVYRIPKNSSEPPKEISPQSTHILPKIVDFTLRRQQGSLRMRLHRMRDVIGSHTRVEWPAEGDVMESKVLSTKCVYHGKVDGMENSLATIDLCSDMVRDNIYSNLIWSDQINQIIQIDPIYSNPI